MRAEDENPLDPGTDPTTPPLGKYDIKFDEAIKNEPLKIQCTWANCFTEPVWNRGLCIRSYDSHWLRAITGYDGVIATTTGNYYVAEGDVVWIEATLKYCNRRPIGWFRENDIWHAKKGTIDPNRGENKKEKKTNWLTWLITGVSVLKIIS